ncbi:MAG: hypothetical protein H6732_02455 [Alphaproteobacteria bacterium]|nr:hypothetical protein [Alphaproteobacteria bacterium]
MPLLRVALLATLLVFVLYGRETMSAFVPSGDSEVSAAIDRSSGGGDVGAAARMLGKHAAAMAEASMAVKELSDPDHAVEVATDRWGGLLDSYAEVRALGLAVLVGLPLVWILLGFGAAYASFAFVARKLGEGGVAIARGWLGLVSTAAPLLTVITGDLIWPSLPAEWVLVPAVWVVASAAMQRVVDENAPAWNATILALCGTVAGMAASLVLFQLDPLGVQATVASW